MILVKKMQIAEGSLPYEIHSIFSKDIFVLIGFLSLSMGDRNPITYLKDTDTNDLIKMEIIDNQIIKSYILDLFDFESEFKSLIE